MVIVRKLVTKEDAEKKRKRNYIIIGIVMVFLMVLSPAGYTMLRDDSSSSNNNNDNVLYNGVKFIKDANGYWQFSYGGKNFITRYNPNEVNDSKSLTGLSLSNYQGEVLSFEWNESQEGATELIQNLFYINQIPLRVVPRACLNEECKDNIPVKSCSEDKVISFKIPKKGEEERIYTQENCVFIIANETNQMKYADAFLFDIIGI